MPQDKLYDFYNAIKSNPTIEGLPKDYETFKTTLSDKGKAKAFFDVIKTNNTIEGLPNDYETFSSALGLGDKGFFGKAPQVGAKPSSKPLQFGSATMQEALDKTSTLESPLPSKSVKVNLKAKVGEDNITPEQNFNYNLPKYSRAQMYNSAIKRNQAIVEKSQKALEPYMGVINNMQDIASGKYDFDPEFKQSVIDQYAEIKDIVDPLLSDYTNANDKVQYFNEALSGNRKLQVMGTDSGFKNRFVNVGLNELGALTSNALAGTLNVVKYVNPEGGVNKTMEDLAARFSQVADKYKARAEYQSALMDEKDNYANKEISDIYKQQGLLGATEYAAKKFTESIPITLGIMGASMTGAGGALVANYGLFAGSAQDRYKQLANVQGMSEADKIANALGYGTSELLFEGLLASGMGSVYKQMITTMGKEAAEKAIKKSAVDVITKGIKKYMPLSGAVVEGLGEGATQFTQNLIDKYTNPEAKNIDLMNGVADATAIGFVGGGAMAAPISLPTAVNNTVGYVNKSINKKQIDKLAEQKTALDEAAQDPNLSENAKEIIDQSRQEILEKQNDIAIEDRDILANQLTDEQREQVKLLQDNINNIDAALLEIKDETQQEPLIKQKEKIQKEIDGIYELATPNIEENGTKPSDRNPIGTENKVEPTNGEGTVEGGVNGEPELVGGTSRSPQTRVEKISESRRQGEGTPTQEKVEPSKMTKSQLIEKREKKIREIYKKAEGSNDERALRYKELVAEFGEKDAILKLNDEIKARAEKEISKLPPLPKTKNEIINEKGESDFVKIKKDLGFKNTDFKWGDNANPFGDEMGDMLKSDDGATVVFIKPNEKEIYDEINDTTDTVTNGIKIELVYTKKENRGKGSAKKQIKKITDWADKNNTDLFLDIAPQDELTSSEGLKKLYESFGFVFDGIHGFRKPQPSPKEKVELTDEEKTNLQKIADDLKVNFREVQNIYNKYGEGKSLSEITKADFIAAQAKRGAAKLESFEPEKVSSEEEFSEAVDNFKKAFSDWWGSPQKMGIAYDPKADARKLLALHDSLVKLAKAAIKLGYVTVDDFAAHIGKKVDATIKRAFRDAENELAGAPRIYNTEEDISNAAAAEVDEAFEGIEKDIFEAQEFAKPTLWQKTVRQFFDEQGRIKTELLNKGEKKAVYLRNLIRGAGEAAKQQYAKFNKEIYSKLKKGEKVTLDKIILMRRIIQLDTNYDNKGATRLKHPKGLNKEKATQWLDKLKTNHPELFAKLDKRADHYFDAMRELLKKQLDNGLITQEIYDDLVSNEYSPRKYIQYLLPQEMRNYGAVGDNKLIKALEEGSEEAMFYDSEWLLKLQTLITEKRVFKNRADNALYDFADATPNNGLVEIMPNVFTKPKAGWEVVPMYKDGVLTHLQMPIFLATEWNFNPPILDVATANTIRHATGGSLLRAMATGYNPFFPIANTIRDIQHILLYTNTYSQVLPVGFAQILNDARKVSKDALLRKGIFEDYVAHGGGMDLLTVEGRPISTYNTKTIDPSKITKTAHTFFGALNEFSEMIFRLSVYKRNVDSLTEKFVKDNGREPSTKELDDIKYEATNEARAYIDFSQGGRASKAIDTVIPYFNASMQGLRVAGTYAKRNPLALTVKLSQLFGVVGIYMAANLATDDDKDDWSKIPSYIKQNNIVIMFPKWFEDIGISPYETIDGVKRRKYLKLPKTQEARIVMRGFEAMQEKMAGVQDVEQKSNYDKMVDASLALGNYLNPIEGMLSVPIISSARAYMDNVDPYTKEKLTQKENVSPYLERTQRTPKFWKDLGELTKEYFGEERSLSPDRLRGAAKQIFTDPNNNLWASLLGTTYELATADKEVAKSLGEYMGDAFKPAKNKLIGVAAEYNKENLKTIKDFERQENDAHTLQYEKIKDLVTKYKNATTQKEKSQIDNEFAKYREQQLPKDRKAAHEFYRSAKEMIGMSPFMYQMKFVKDPEAQARFFFQYWSQMNDKQKNEAITNAKHMGMEKAFFKEFHILKELQEAAKNKIDNEK